MEKKSAPKSVRLTPAGESLHAALVEKLGISNTSVFELAIRRLAELEGISIERLDSEEDGQC